MFFKNISEDEFKEYKEFFEKNDYVLIKNIITDEAKELFNNSIQFTDETLKDKAQFGRRHNPEMNKHEVIEKFQNDTLDFYKKIIGEKYFKTFAFAMEYIKDAEVLPHLDFVINEVSSTICYYSEKEYPIYLSSRYIENNYNHRYSLATYEGIPVEERIKINSECGDIVIFNGRNHLHWREKLTDDIKYRAILSHYSFTKSSSEEYKKKTSENVPYENSLSVIYKK